MSHRIDVSEFVALRSVLDLRRVAVEARRPDHLQSLGRILRSQLRDNRGLGFAVSAPVRPEEQQHRRSFERSGRRQRRSQKLIRLQRRRDPPLKREQIQILLNAIVNRGVAIRPQRRLQQRDRLRLLPAGSQAPATALRAPLRVPVADAAPHRADAASVVRAPGSSSLLRKPPPGRIAPGRARRGPARNTLPDIPRPCLADYGRN